MSRYSHFFPTEARFLKVSCITSLQSFFCKGFSRVHSSRVNFTATSSKATGSYTIPHMCREWMRLTALGIISRLPASPASSLWLPRRRRWQRERGRGRAARPSPGSREAEAARSEQRRAGSSCVAPPTYLSSAPDWTVRKAPPPS